MDEQVLANAKSLVNDFLQDPFISPTERAIVESISSLVAKVEHEKRLKEIDDEIQSSLADPYVEPFSASYVTTTHTAPAESEMCKCASTCTTSRKLKTLGMTSYSWCELKPNLLTPADQASFHRAYQNGISCMTPSGRKAIQRYTGTSGADAKYFRECEPSNEEFLVRDGQSMAFTQPSSNTSNLVWNTAKAVGAAAAVGAALYTAHTEMDKRGVYRDLSEQAGQISKTAGEYTKDISDHVSRWFGGGEETKDATPRPMFGPDPAPITVSKPLNTYFPQQTPVGTLSPAKAAAAAAVQERINAARAARIAEQNAEKERNELLQREEAAKILVAQEEARAEELDRIAQQNFENTLRTKKEVQNALTRLAESKSRRMPQTLIAAEEKMVSALQNKYNLDAKRANAANNAAVNAKTKAHTMETERVAKEPTGTFLDKAWNSVTSTASNTWDSVKGMVRRRALARPPEAYELGPWYR